MSLVKRAPLGATTRELVVAAQNHDEKALEFLFSANEALIRAATARVPGTKDDFDTYVQDARIEFAAAIKAFRPNKGASFSTYAYTRMVHVVTKATTKAHRSSKRWSQPLIGGSDEEGGTPDPPDPDDAFARVELRDAVKRLPTMESRLLDEMYWKDASQAAIARRWGISQQAISKRHQVAINLLRSHLGA